MSKLHQRLKDSQKIKDNDEAVKEVFEAFGEHFGEEAEKSRKKANVYLGAIIGVVVFIITIAMIWVN